MIEYLHDAIRATAGREFTLTAKVTDDDGNPVTEGLMLMIHSDEDMLISADGELYDNMWFFTVPADATKGLHGRYWYCIATEKDQLCFKKPLYLL